MSTYKVKEHKDTRSGFGEALMELAAADERVVGLCADLTGSLKMNEFAQKYPQRFFQTGIAEANMIGIAAGMASAGKIPLAATFANFGSGRVYDQIRQSVAYSKKNVKICVSHAGLTLGEDGATHQMLEDLGMMKMLPNMCVINPCDFQQTKQATLAVAKYEGPVYLRFGRPKMPVFIPEDMPFQIGKAINLKPGKHVSIMATGHLVWPALQAADELNEKGIDAEVINIHTIKPLDQQAIIQSAQKTGCVVTAEEHMLNGGLGESIAATLGTNMPTPIEMVGVNDTFGESGKPQELMEKYGLTWQKISNAALKVLQRKS